MHEIWIYFLTKSILLKHYENANKKNVHNMSQGPPNPGFMQEKVQKGDFLKKPSRELIFFVVLWISQRSWTLNYKRLVFLLSKILYKQCDKGSFWKVLIHYYNLMHFHQTLCTASERFLCNLPDYIPLGIVRDFWLSFYWRWKESFLKKIFAICNNIINIQYMRNSTIIY